LQAYAAQIKRFKPSVTPTTLFYKNTRLIFAQNLRTIQPQQKNKVSTTASSQLRENKQKLHSLFNKLA